jgi:hypothetical protein
VVAVRDDPIRAVALVLDFLGIQPRGLAEGVAEADVGQPGRVQVHAQGQMVEVRAEAPSLPRHAGRCALPESRR